MVKHIVRISVCPNPTILFLLQRYKKIEKQRDFKAPQALSGDTELTARAANVLNSGAKVQNKSEITKLSKKKERAATVELQNTNLIA